MSVRICEGVLATKELAAALGANVKPKTVVRTARTEMDVGRKRIGFQKWSARGRLRPGRVEKRSRPCTDESMLSFGTSSSCPRGCRAETPRAPTDAVFITLGEQGRPRPLGPTTRSPQQ